MSTGIEYNKQNKNFFIFFMCSTVISVSYKSLFLMQPSLLAMNAINWKRSMCVFYLCSSDGGGT